LPQPRRYCGISRSHAAPRERSTSDGEGRVGKQNFHYVAEEDDYVCPAGEQLAHHYATEENGLVLRRYWTNACQSCAIKVSSICRAMRLGSSATDVGEDSRHTASRGTANCITRDVEPERKI
jgi:hypothetical protein